MWLRWFRLRSTTVSALSLSINFCIHFGGFDSAQPPFLCSTTVLFLRAKNFHFGGFGSAQSPYLCSVSVLIFVFTSVVSTPLNHHICAQSPTTPFSRRFNTMTEKIFTSVTERSRSHHICAQPPF